MIVLNTLNKQHSHSSAKHNERIKMTSLIYLSENIAPNNDIYIYQYTSLNLVLSFEEENGPRRAGIKRILQLVVFCILLWILTSEYSQLHFITKT